MNNKKTSLLITATFALSVIAVMSRPVARQPNGEMWRSVSERSVDQAAKRLIIPTAYQTVRLDQAALAQLLVSAPMEFTRHAIPNPIISLPMPDGTQARFLFEESPVMEPTLAIQYPNLKTYRAQGIDDPTATARFDWLPTGFHAIILASSGTVLIAPYAEGNTGDYITYWKKDAANTTDPIGCGVKDWESAGSPASQGNVPAVIAGGILRTYRLALACTNEYAVAVGGNTVAGTIAAETSIINLVNGVFEREVAIHMNMIDNTAVTYAGDNFSCGGACNASNDPYTNSNCAGMLGENHDNLTHVIGADKYDIGHVFSTCNGGNGGVGTVCGPVKEWGSTGVNSYVAVSHEIGHQFGANHTFNGNCNGSQNQNNASAYEVGGGATIMGYVAGTCGNQSLPPPWTDTFHVKSLEEIVAYSQSGGGNSCAVLTATGVTPPNVSGPGNFTIPKQTPFSLTASTTDPIRGATYDWQEYDLDAGGMGTTAVPNTDADGTPRPIFRVYLPATKGTRTFPSLQYILSNANVPPATTNLGGFFYLTGELLPAISRTMIFQVVARHNNAINTAQSAVTIDGAATPFAVTSPNAAIDIPSLALFNVTWVASGNAANVKISLSTDGGNTFPTVLAASTPNDGAQTVLIPHMPTNTARIKVEAVGNIYFDISNTNFTILDFPPAK
jgi:Metallo-peptidase family M12